MTEAQQPHKIPEDSPGLISVMNTLQEFFIETRLAGQTTATELVKRRYAMTEWGEERPTLESTQRVLEELTNQGVLHCFPEEQEGEALFMFAPEKRLELSNQSGECAPFPWKSRRGHPRGHIG